MFEIAALMLTGERHDAAPQPCWGALRTVGVGLQAIHPGGSRTCVHLPAMCYTDDEGEVKAYEPGALIVLKQGERHRLVGLNDWGVIAEIWQHTHESHPSDEDDIVRVQDDFGR